MSSCISFIFLFLFSFLTSFTASAQKPSFIYHICPNTTTYTRNSTYFTNLQTLLSTLSSRNASYSTGFQNTTVGQAPNRVTGLFLCRGDVSPEICRSCVASSVNDTTNLCPKESEAVLYYDECMLRYSHRNILSTVSFDGGAILLNAQNISSNQVDRFKDLVNSTLNQAAVEGASNTRKFYTRKANWTALESLHAMVQCTPDLTSLDCSSCLQQTINGMPMYRIGGRLLRPSCSIRYELYAFYNETAVTTSSPPSPSPSPSPLPLPSQSPSPSAPPPTLVPESTPPVSSPPKHGKGGKSGVSVVAMVVPIIVLFCFS